MLGVAPQVCEDVLYVAGAMIAALGHYRATSGRDAHCRSACAPAAPHARLAGPPSRRARGCAQQSARLSGQLDGLTVPQEKEFRHAHTQ